MRVYYDTTGAVTGTVIGQHLDLPPGIYIEVPDDPEFGPLDAYRVIDGALVHTPLDAAEVLAQERATMIASRFQAKAALLGAGHLPAVEAAIAEADALTQLAWAEAVELRRTSPMIAALAAAIGLTDEAVDALFRTAMQIEA